MANYSRKKLFPTT